MRELEKDNTISSVALVNASKRQIRRREMATKAVKSLTKGERSPRVSEMRANIVERMVRNKIRMATPPYTMYPRERHPTPTVGVKTMIIVAAAVVPHWRIKARIDA